MGVKKLFEYCVDVLRNTLQRTQQDPALYSPHIPQPVSKSEYTKGILTVLSLLVDALARVNSSTRRTMTMLVFNIINTAIHSLLGRRMGVQGFLLSTAFAFACSSSVDLYNLWVEFNYGKTHTVTDDTSSWFSPLRSLSRLVSHSHDEVIEQHLLTADGRYTVVYNLLALWRSDNLEEFDKEIAKLQTVGAEYPNKWVETIDLARSLSVKEKLADLDVFEEILLEQRALAVAKNTTGVVHVSNGAYQLNNHNASHLQDDHTDSDASDSETSTPEFPVEERYTERPVDSDAMLQNIDLQYDPDVFRKYNDFRTHRRSIAVQQRAREAEQRAREAEQRARAGQNGVDTKKAPATVLNTNKSRWSVPIPNISVPKFLWGNTKEVSAQWDRVTLEQLTRAELQAVAKDHQIPRNITSKRIINELLARNALRGRDAATPLQQQPPLQTQRPLSTSRADFWDRASLQELTYKQLQAIVMSNSEVGIAANQRRDILIDSIATKNIRKSMVPSRNTATPSTTVPAVKRPVAPVKTQGDRVASRRGADAWDRAALATLSYRQLQDIAKRNPDSGIRANKSHAVLLNSIAEAHLPKTAPPPASPRIAAQPSKPSQTPPQRTPRAPRREALPAAGALRRSVRLAQKTN